ncbi:DNA-binding NarL/FixJ family response regulator [Methylobacterium fujisawaense]|uniref:DNA-binding NarL/FixJ family response regulator n=1 Tax=Methylobacterium fujisawaense TaxID=107400 RepID=A0ABR6DIN6_9HYPH|nr:response regulator [Methylobacterium fujisawaense]MBA9065643.1 DNA-binding NarL/FixJ family response regulator [Methylobacterium fujisawaense]
MRLEFTLLWFENQIAEVRPAIQGLKAHLEEAGFELCVLEEADDTNIDAHARNQESFHDIDLIVVDLDLGEAAASGDEIAQQIRRRFKFTDIVFYSGVAPSELRGRIQQRNVDGVYCMARSELRANLIELVDDLIRRMSRLEAMRGLAVATAGKADLRMRAILKALHEGADEAGKAELVAFIDKEVKDGDDRLQRKYEGAATLAEKVDSLACTSMVLLKATKKFVGQRQELRTQRTVLGRYQVEVMDIRNSLGHATETRTSDGWVIRAHGGGNITRDDFPTFRQSFSRHLSNLDALCEILGVQVTGDAEKG